MATIILSDIDGTFLDHHTYTAIHSLNALHKLQERDIPLVFCSSKTFAEQRHLQRLYHISHPFILENGSAVAIPEAYFSNGCYSCSNQVDGYDIVPLVNTSTENIRALLSVQDGLDYYGNVPDRMLERITGLANEDMARAKTRWYTETLVTSLNEYRRAKIRQLLSTHELILSRGGRFDTVQSALTDKGRAVAWLMPLFFQKYKQRLSFAGVGDSANDLPMLKTVDRAFLVQKPDGTWAESDDVKITRIQGVGPSGFSRMVDLLLEGD